MGRPHHRQPPARLARACAIAFIAVGCTGPSAPDSEPPICTGPACAGSDAGVVVDPDAGPAIGDPDAGPEDRWQFNAVFGVANVDDDDDSGVADWDQPAGAAENDLSSFTLGADALATLAPDEQLGLTLGGDTDAVRIYLDGEHVLGDGVGTSLVLPPPSGSLSLEVEFGAFNAHGVLVVDRRSAGGLVLESGSIALRASPAIMNHHLQPAEHVWAVGVHAPGYDNSALIDAYASVLGERFTEVPGPSYGWDVWMQDEIEFATCTGDGGQRLDVVIDSIRNRGLAPFAGDYLVSPDVVRGTWGNPAAVSTFDSFGNLEASPPVVVGGVDYPFGRIYYGRAAGRGLNPTLAEFLAEQEIQKPFALDTRWLCVGHVDEFSTFVPDPGSDKGFKLLLADVPAGYALLDALDPDLELPLYAADYGYDTVGDILDDEFLRSVNASVQEDYLDPIAEAFTNELGLSETDIVRIPTLFEQVSGCGGRVAALMPGMVNLIVADDEAGSTHLFVPDPFLRSDPEDQTGDAMIEAFADAMPEALKLHFVDNWDVYHLGLGEIHCGTNVQRAPLAEWWQVGLHLLGGLL